MAFAIYRIEKEILDLKLPPNFKFEKITDLQYYFAFIVHKGPYKNKKLDFTIFFSENYPFIPPRIRSNKELFHPNIYEQKVCHKILNLEWRPVFGIRSIIFSIYLLFHEIETDDCFNDEAAEMINNNYDKFLEKINEL